MTLSSSEVLTYNKQLRVNNLGEKIIRFQGQKEREKERERVSEVERKSKVELMRDRERPRLKLIDFERMGSRVISKEALFCQVYDLITCWLRRGEKFICLLKMICFETLIH